MVQATNPNDIFDRILTIVSPLDVVIHPKCIDSQVGILIYSRIPKLFYQFPMKCMLHLHSICSRCNIKRSGAAILVDMFTVSLQDTNQTITAISNKPYPPLDSGRDQYFVEFYQDDKKLDVLPANLYNPHVLLLQNPGNIRHNMSFSPF